MNNKVKIGIIVCIVLLLGVIGFSWYTEKHKDDKYTKEVQRNLTAEDRKIFEDRITDYKSKLGASKDDAEKYNIYLNLGYTEYALGHLLDSESYFNEAIKINADQYDVYAGLFQTQIDMQDYSGAEVSIKKAISIRKGVADLWRKYIQFKIDRINVSNQEINDLFTEAINDTTKNGDTSNVTDVYTFYASWLEKIGNLQESVNYWKKAIDSNPQSKQLYQTEIDRIQKLIK